VNEATAPRFVPWLRSGLATTIATVAVDGLAPHDTASAVVSVQAHAIGSGGETAKPVPAPEIRLRGPGDVVGIDPLQVVRHDPEPGAADAEPTYFALVEFAAPDLPWRFTPAAPDGDLLQPWIALVVVEERDGVSLEDRSAGLPILHVDNPSVELPDLRQCWAWAHVHADHDLAAGLAAALAASPDAFRSRLICPRRLPAGTPWLACVVPTFEAGRRAGLGESGGIDLGPAWDNAATSEVQLPVYHSWRFSTGGAGDFESLARRLQPRELEGSVGRRDLDISDPGGGLPSSPGSLVSYEGGLVSPAGASRLWDPDQREAMKAALRKTLNLEIDRGPVPSPYRALRDDPVVGPPAYAAPQARRRAVPKEGQSPDWFEQLNTEPHRRVVAGLGAEVVRNDQEALMAAAWEYAAGLREVNRTLTSARLAWELARKAQPRFATLADAQVVQIAEPAMSRLAHPSGLTVRGALDDSALPAGLVSGAFRRLATTVRGFETLAGDAGRRRVPATAAVTAAALADPVGFVAGWGSVHPPLGCGVERALPPDLDAAVATPKARRVALRAKGKRPKRFPADSASPKPYDFPRPALDQGLLVPYTGNAEPVAGIAGSVRAALDPAGTVVKMVEARVIGLPTDRDEKVPPRLDAQPRFTTPMCERLLALSIDYLVPGIGAVPDNTLGLLEVNREFIEAFLAGLNNELSREFVWREYPARLDATWAQQFWDSGPDDPADIAPIGSWGENTPLGVHPPRTAHAATLVLLLKGALARRYPDLRVYAVEAEWADGKRREAVPGKVRLPVFAGMLERDTYFYGFTLTEREARGNTNPGRDDPGWFFVLEEQPSAARFGLDAPTPKARGKAPKNWSALCWSHLVAEGDPLPGFVDTSGPSWLVEAGPLPGNGGKDAWGKDAAAMARITFQRPVRMLTHADAMLPEASRPVPRPNPTPVGSRRTR
jgi:hypothetical protein